MAAHRDNIHYRRRLRKSNVGGLTHQKGRLLVT
jgi:hypothetical protein